MRDFKITDHLVYENPVSGEGRAQQGARSAALEIVRAHERAQSAHQSAAAQVEAAAKALDALSPMQKEFLAAQQDRALKVAAEKAAADKATADKAAADQAASEKAAAAQKIRGREGGFRFREIPRFRHAHHRKHRGDRPQKARSSAPRPAADEASAQKAGRQGNAAPPVFVPAVEHVMDRGYSKEDAQRIVAREQAKADAQAENPDLTIAELEEIALAVIPNPAPASESQPSPDTKPGE